MKKIIEVLYLILAFLSPFGSANIFNLGQYSTRLDSDDGGILPVFFGLCTIVSVCDKSIRKHFSFIRPIIVTLVLFVATLLLGELLYCNGNFGYVYFIKLCVAIFGFVMMTQTFIAYPLILKRSLLVYSLTTLGIVLAFFLGFLENSYYYSNGRLWFLGVNPNTYSFMVGFAIINFVIYIHQNDTTIRNKILSAISIAPLFFFLLLSGSRGSLLFLLLAIIIIYYKKLIYLVIVGVLSLVLLGTYLSNSNYEISTFDRMSQIGSGSEREVLIERTMTIFKQSPVLGVGPTGYKSNMLLRYNEERDSHNVMISNLALGGVLGTLFYLFFLIQLLKLVNIPSRYKLYSIAIYIYMTLVSLKTGNVLTYSLMWYIYAIVLSLSYVGRLSLSNK